MEIFGDVLTEEGNQVSLENLERVLKRPVIKPRFRISVLNPDETVDYVIPDEDIAINGIQYTEEYQNGQRRNIRLTLLNEYGKYTPHIDGIWLTTKFKLEVGLVTTGNITVWFPRGIYVLSNIDLNGNNEDKQLIIQLKDKYAIFEGRWGTLEDPYEVELGSDIEDAINGIMNFTMGNGYIYDYKTVILDPSFIGFKTQNTIRIEEGGNLGQVIEALATQLSAEYYYNNVGNLCFYPINETVNDDVKPVIWVFEKVNREISTLTLTYRNDDVVNAVKVVGDNIDNGIYSAVVANENPASPICVQRIGRRAAPKYTAANIWSDDLAYDLARYYLRKNSFVAIDFQITNPFNPILTVNNICEIENDFLHLKRDKVLITSISYGSQDGIMTIKLCSVDDLPFKS